MEYLQSSTYTACRQQSFKNSITFNSLSSGYRYQSPLFSSKIVRLTALLFCAVVGLFFSVIPVAYSEPEENSAGFDEPVAYESEYILTEYSDTTGRILGLTSQFAVSEDEEVAKISRQRKRKRKKLRKINPLKIASDCYKLIKRIEKKTNKKKKHRFYCEPNLERKFSIATEAVSSDSISDRQWHLGNRSRGGTNSRDAWKLATGSEEVVVAVIDSGINTSHPDLKDIVYRNTLELEGDLVDNDANGFRDDYYGVNTAFNNGDVWDCNGHGSHVAGIIAAVKDNNIGVAGIASGVKILPINPARDCGGTFTTFASVKALEYVYDLKVNKGVNIVAVNASFGAYGSSEAERAAIAKLQEIGVFLVAAAGNSGESNDLKPLYPAGYNLENIISVGSSSATKRLSTFSNFGASSVDILAPGEGILSTYMASIDNPEHYKILSGTSMAVPMVSGALALLYSVRPDMSLTEARQVLLTHGRSYLSLARYVISGRTLDVAEMIAMALGVTKSGEAIDETTLEANSTKLKRGTANDNQGSSSTDIVPSNDLINEDFVPESPTVLSSTNSRKYKLEAKYIPNVKRYKWTVSYNVKSRYGVKPITRKFNRSSKILNFKLPKKVKGKVRAKVRYSYSPVEKSKVTIKTRFSPWVIVK